MEAAIPMSKIDFAAVAPSLGWAIGAGAPSAT